MIDDEEESADSDYQTEECVKYKEKLQESSKHTKIQLSKISAIEEENDKQKQKEYRRLKRIKKTALKSSLIKDLKKEFNEAPEEIFEREEIYGKKFSMK